MKKGDIVFCHKCYKSTNTFKKNLWYEILTVQENVIGVNTYATVLYSKYCAYFFTKEEFKANFYTKSEVRKLKLNKINETNLQ